MPCDHTDRASREEGDGERGGHQAARGAAEPEGQARRQERAIQVGVLPLFLLLQGSHDM